jgi:hypothetical protein
MERLQDGRGMILPAPGIAGERGIEGIGTDLAREAKDSGQPGDKTVHFERVEVVEG